MATICSLNNPDKEELLVPISGTKKSESKAQNIDIAMIDADLHCTGCYSKRA